MPVDVRPCQKIGAKTFCFLVDLTKERALVLDNLVWAVATKAIPIKEWRKEWKTVTLPEDKITKMLSNLAAYAIFAGLTPEAAEYLPQMTPMTEAAQRVAKAKGVELLERYKTQAEIEEAAEKAGRPLHGAALIAKARKIMADAGETGETHVLSTAAEPEQLVEPGTANNAAETDGAISARRRGTGTAKKLKRLADDVTKVLAEAEAKGENPAKTLAQAKVPKPPAKFDRAKLKGADGQYKSASAMFKGLILEAKLSDEAIFRAVQKKFGLGDDKRSYVNWNRNWLKKEGILTT